MTKNAMLYCECDEEWYLSFKGTPYESLAYELLDDEYALDLEVAAHEDVISGLYDELYQIEYRLKKLNLDRMRDMPAGQQIIIINADTRVKHAWFGEASDLQGFLDAFAGTPQEPEAMRTAKEYLDIKEQINKLEEDTTDFGTRRDDISNQKESLSMEALQRNVEERIPTTGIEAFPEMAGELAELMEGVSMDEPLELMSYAASEEKQEFVPVEKRVIEIDTDGINHAEKLEEDRLKYEKGDKVTLSKALDSMNAGGAPHTFPKGSVGEISSIFDGQGHAYMVHFDDGGLVMVPADQLTK